MKNTRTKSILLFVLFLTAGTDGDAVDDHAAV